jgi:hypothetical protein
MSALKANVSAMAAAKLPGWKSSYEALNWLSWRKFCSSHQTTAWVTILTPFQEPAGITHPPPTKLYKTLKSSKHPRKLTSLRNPKKDKKVMMKSSPLQTPRAQPQL